MSTPPDPPLPAVAPATPPSLRRYRLYAGLTFAFAWIPVMYTAFTVDRGFTPDQYLALWAAYYVAMVGAELPSGWLADRWGRRPLLVAGPLGLAGCFAVLAEAQSYAVCWWAMAATGASHALISGADSAWLYDQLAARGRRQDALREEASAHRWRLFGVSALDVAGGLLAHAAGTRWAFHLSVLVMLFAAATALRLAKDPPRAPVPAAAAHGPRPGLRGALAAPGVAWGLAWYLVVFVLLRVGFQLYQPTLLAEGATDLRVHGALLGALNLVAGLSVYVVRRVHGRYGERLTSGLVVGLQALSFAGLALAGGGWVFPLFCLQQVSFAFLQPIGRTSLNHRIPAEQRAALLSLQSLLARLAFGALLALGTWDAALGSALRGSYAALALAAALAAVVLHATWRPAPVAAAEAA